jgi:hypothetical protein
MNLYDLLFNQWGAETLSAPVTRRHYIDGVPMRTERGGYKPPKPRPEKDAEARKAILEALRENPGATSQKLAEITGKTVANASRQMYVMTGLGMVTSKPGPYPAHGGQRKNLYFIAEGV